MVMICRSLALALSLSLSLSLYLSISHSISLLRPLSWCFVFCRRVPPFSWPAMMIVFRDDDDDDDDGVISSLSSSSFSFCALYLSLTSAQYRPHQPPARCERRSRSVGVGVGGGVARPLDYVSRKVQYAIQVMVGDYQPG
jgi:hypothetical protein